MYTKCISRFHFFNLTFRKRTNKPQYVNKGNLSARENPLQDDSSHSILPRYFQATKIKIILTSGTSIIPSMPDSFYGTTHPTSISHYSGATFGSDSGDLRLAQTSMCTRNNITGTVQNQPQLHINLFSSPPPCRYCINAYEILRIWIFVTEYVVALQRWNVVSKFY